MSVYSYCIVYMLLVVSDRGSLPHGELRREQGPPREIHPRVHPQELPQPSESNCRIMYFSIYDSRLYCGMFYVESTAASLLLSYLISIDMHILLCVSFGSSRSTK